MMSETWSGLAALLWRQRELLPELMLYLAPSLALAFLIRFLAARHPFFFVFTMLGTLCHELAHFVVGALTGARPHALRLWPRRTGHGWELGSVLLGRVRWYNAAPAALAPLLVLALPLIAAAWRVQPGWRFGWFDVALAFALAPQFLACWPSRIDWRVALRSWPYLPLAALLALFWRLLPP